MKGILAVLALLGGVGASAAGWAADFVDEYRAAGVAHKAGQYAEMEARLKAALAQRPGHPAALYDLAAAQARQGRQDEALATLDQLADMGLSYAPEKDADFAALHGTPALAALVKRFEQTRRPAGESRVVLRIPNSKFIPEGIAYDFDTASYYVGSARLRAIARERRGEIDESFVMPGSGGLLAPLGMVADSRRRLLWVAHSGIPQMKNHEPKELGRAGVIAYDLDDGSIRKRAKLPEDGRKHLLGDLVQDKGRDFYVSDSEAGLLWHLDSSKGDFRALTQPGQLASPQGLALSKDGEVLYVADHARGLFAYDVKAGTLRPLEVAPGVCVYGIDGLYRHDDDLIAVQNGIRPHRVVRLRLDAGGRRVKSAHVLAANLPEFDEPTLGVVTGDRFSFVANSQWSRFDKNNRLPPRSELRIPVILSIALD